MQPHQVIQSYRLLHFLGDGGMGEVWMAEHTRIGERVAIKCLHTSLARNADLRLRFRQEASTLAKLRHPNIVAILDYFEEGDGVFLVLEYVDGMPLDKYIAQSSGPIPEQQAIHLFAQMLEGLGHAHQLKLIHRDIKPGNFMITPSKIIKVLDFGIAKAMDTQSLKLTKTGARMGTVLYMSPEQVRAQAMDARSDIYSLGVTLFQMVTGQCPYDAQSSEFEVFSKIVQEPMPRARDFYPVVSPHMQAVIDKATAKRPQDRFQTCAEFEAALWKLSGVPVSAPEVHVQRPAQHAAGRPEPSKPKRKGRKRYWSLLNGGLGTVAVLMLAAVVGYFAWFKQAYSEESAMRVAEEFLVAVESSDREKVKRLADKDCGEQMGMYFDLESRSMNRFISMGSASVYDWRAFVKYSCDGQDQSLSLRWDWYRWKVECTKVEIM